MSELKYFKHCDLESKTVKEFLETSDVKLLLNDLNNFFDLIQMPGGYTFYFHILGYGDKPKHIAVRIVRLMYGTLNRIVTQKMRLLIQHTIDL